MGAIAENAGRDGNALGVWPSMRSRVAGGDHGPSIPASAARRDVTVIVPDEAALSRGERHISGKSPLGRALLGRGVGEEVMLRTGTGVHFLRIRGVT
jgi:transcription elongation GreA/GreB family factor